MYSIIHIYDLKYIFSCQPFSIIKLYIHVAVLGRYYYFRKDFRPWYGRIGVSGSLFPGVPILALTATASTQIEKLHQLRERKKLHQLRERKKEITSTK
jgi:hypothetical protein